MTLDEFLGITEKRIPTVEEMLSLCDHLGIGFEFVGDKPTLKPNGCRNEALALVKLFRREPFRAMVIKARLQRQPAITFSDQDTIDERAAIEAYEREQEAKGKQ